VEIRQHVQKDLPPVLTDPTQIHQILMNLCANGAHAMRERGGALTVELTQEDFIPKTMERYAVTEPRKFLKLTVADTGHGMAETVAQRVFEPYYTTKRPGEGTGLGLALVHGIVTSHGGVITVDSRPGEGAEFRVYLPAVEEEVSDPVDTDDSVLAGGQESILLVDDEAALADIGKQTLESLGYRVTACSSPTEALDFFQEAPARFDLVMTDMTMPHMTGVELSQAIMRIRSDVPVVLCTGFSELVGEEEARAMKIRGFVMKPIRKSEMAVTVRRVLDGN
jgi:CheY-like chemotaxis protein